MAAALLVGLRGAKDRSFVTEGGVRAEVDGGGAPGAVPAGVTEGEEAWRPGRAVRTMDPP